MYKPVFKNWEVTEQKKLEKSWFILIFYFLMEGFGFVAEPGSVQIITDPYPDPKEAQQHTDPTDPQHLYR